MVAATSLGALRISDSMDDIQQLDNMKLLTEMTKQATELAAALQEERDQSAGPLAHGSDATDYTVKGYREKTDRAVTSLHRTPPRRSTPPARTATSRASARASSASPRDLDTLDKIRSAAYEAKDNSPRRSTPTTGSSATCSTSRRTWRRRPATRR